MKREYISKQYLLDAVDDGWVKFDTEEDYNRMIHLIRDISPVITIRGIRWEDIKSAIILWKCKREKKKSRKTR